ncbi:hypothetical protein KC571_02880, partial [candidate division WWE3 bacterium]|nr:hypothetical protein [candidate division WWE3 bacterium]
LFGVDLWFEDVTRRFTFTHAGKKNFAIEVAKERLTELLELNTSDPEVKIVALYELDKALVKVINEMDPSQTDIIAALQHERMKTARLIAILQGVYTTPNEQHEETNEDEFAEGDESSEYDEFFDLGTSLIQSLDQSKTPSTSVQTNQQTPLPTNTPIPTPTQPTYQPPTATPPPPTPSPTTVTIPTATPTPNLGQGQEIEFTSVLKYENNHYTMNHSGTTYEVLNGSNYAQYVNETLKIHALLYTQNRIQLTEVEVDN